MPRVVSVLNEKGGVGKTTTAMSLAAVAAEKMKARVLLVDVDPQSGSSLRWAEQAEENGVTLPFDFTAEHDERLLSQIRLLPDYDIVVVDTPGSLENLGRVQTVIEASDYVIMPTEASYLPIASLGETIQKVVAPARVPYRVLLNRVSNKSDCQQAFQDLKDLGIPHFRHYVRAYVAHSRAPLDGLVVTQYKRGKDTNNAIRDYENVAQEMFADWKQIEATLTGSGV
jgi:chromosome partitioning protein